MNDLILNRVRVPPPPLPPHFPNFPQLCGAVIHDMNSWLPLSLTWQDYCPYNLQLVTIRGVNCNNSPSVLGQSEKKVSSMYNNVTTSILTFIWHNLVPRVLFYPCFCRSAGMGRRGPGNEVTFNIQLFKTYLNDHDSNLERSWSNRAEKNARRACKVYPKIPIKYRNTTIWTLI